MEAELPGCWVLYMCTGLLKFTKLGFFKWMQNIYVYGVCKIVGTLMLQVIEIKITTVLFSVYFG